MREKGGQRRQEVKDEEQGKRSGKGGGGGRVGEEERENTEGGGPTYCSGLGGKLLHNPTTHPPPSLLSLRKLPAVTIYFV